MSRDTLDRQINNIKDEILILGNMVEETTLKAVNTLKTRDTFAASEVLEYDSVINEKRHAIENAVIILIATQQPIARDLRILMAIIEISTELERMGDYAKGIAKVTLKLGDSDISIPYRELNKMAECTIAMLHSALSAFVNENLNQARQIPDEDDKVDQLYNDIYHITVQSMMQNPALIDLTNLIMWVAHNLERMADRVTNICERTVFIITGEFLEMDSSDDEEEVMK